MTDVTLFDQPKEKTMGNAALAKQEPAPATEASAIIQMIERAATNPAVDVDKMARLYEMHIEAQNRAGKLAFTRAFSAMQPTLPTIAENGTILNSAGKAQSTYAEWEDINDAIGPILFEHGFTLSFKPGAAADGKVTVTGILRHVDGHEDEATVTLPQDGSGGKNTVQGVGSSLSYGKRYAAIALLNITSRAKRDRDDDGRASGMSEAAQRAISDINLADTLDDLRGWKTKHYDGLTKVLKQSEMADVVALYNRRSKAFRSQPQPADANDFPGDR